MSAKIILSLICLSTGWASFAWMHDSGDGISKNDSNIDDVKPELPPDNLPEKIAFDQIPVGFESVPEAPADNPMTEGKIHLGRRLFFDPILSQDGTVSCASCHQPEHGFASPHDFPIGLKGQKARRNAPSLLNRGYGKSFSWDGRDVTLEEQMIGPLTNEVEMGADLDAVISALRADESYVKQFREVFADENGEAEVENLVSKQ